MEEQLELPFPWHPNSGYRDVIFTWCKNCAKHRWFRTYTNDIRYAVLCSECGMDEKTGIVVTGSVTEKRD